ncbi:5-oxoprolinase subunit PxpA [Arthrospiribacter ruber]|uniref:5-oxoprolinase subunit PxpA n=1 Tax=Arthrospiribacter ruber TaxID=2487934 RepID=A0A951IZC0_9BACT|nr:5-oxoprolinase subunit PxpA [Arthrospiribacter ruber]MBW3468153.1 5-oxoprolinase subunit PxpA [Arthrospiribacter ruber]
MDINCDLGEGLTNDPELMPYLNSCNIACGGHAGDKSTVQMTIKLAKSHGVKIGAHPSFADKVNFGRKILNLTSVQLENTLIDQLDLFFESAHHLGTTVHHIKLHGALYNLAAKDEKTADTFLTLIKERYHSTKVYCPPNSVVENLAKTYQIPYDREVFADRTYQDDGSLTDRKLAKALLTDPTEVIDHLKWIVDKKCILTLSKKQLPVEAETVCIHGDNPSALPILQAIRNHFFI